MTAQVRPGPRHTAVGRSPGSEAGAIGQAMERAAVRGGRTGCTDRTASRPTDPRLTDPRSVSVLARSLAMDPRTVQRRRGFGPSRVHLLIR